MKPEPRRSMTEALRTVDLPPEAVALIREGTPAPQARSRSLALATAVSAVKPNDSPATETALSDLVELNDPLPEKSEPMEKPRAERPSSKPSRPAREKETEPEPLNTQMTLSVRLPSEIPLKILRAATDRKIARVRPWTQQEIVAEALTLWLRKNGYDN